jgi:hypothetical protein
VNGVNPSGRSSRDAQAERVWGTGFGLRIIMCLPIVGATLWTIVYWETWRITETWPAFLVACYLALAALRSRWSVRLTEDELLIRYPIGGQRIARADVVSANFNTWGLVVRKRDGGFAFAFLAPKWNSTELGSGGQPGPDSAAYQITRWAQLGQPDDRSDQPVTDPPGA